MEKIENGKESIMRRRTIASFLFIFAFFLLIRCASADGIVVQQDSVNVAIGSLVPERWYTFFASKGTDISTDNLLYIDELQADPSGEISILFVQAGLPECYFLLAGDFGGQTSPRSAGHYTPDNGGSELPAALQTIKEEAFAGSGYSSVVLGNAVTTIEDRAFANCKNLRRVVIPISVEQIASDAFDGCVSLTIACPQDSAAYDYAIEHGYTVEIIQ